MSHNDTTLTAPCFGLLLRIALQLLFLQITTNVLSKRFAACLFSSDLEAVAQD